MSRNRKKGKISCILREARRRTLPRRDRNLSKQFLSELPSLESKKTKKRLQLQTILHEQKSIYDNVWVGDELDHSSQKSIYFWFQNCNGLIHKNDIRGFQFEIASMADAGINYFSFAETCININKPGYSKKLQDAFTEIIPTGHMSFVNSPSYPKRSNYQPGGVSGGFDGVLRTRFLREGRDEIGRWSWQEFGQNSLVTRVYTLYRVNQGSEYTSGNSTAWFQQKILLEEKQIRNNPRSQIMTDIIQELRPLINKGINVLLMGDFNESVHSNEGMSTKLMELGLFNVMEERLNTKELPRTHSRGSKAIDHVWATKYLLDNIKYAAYAPFGKFYDSDHRGIFLAIDEKILFNEHESKIIYHEFRRLKSGVPKRVKKYMDALTNEWNKHKIDEKYKRLVEKFNSNDPNFEQEINNLDKQITELMIHAEKG